MQNHLMSVVLKNGATCFNALPIGCDTLACDKFYACFMAAVLGCGPQAVKPCPNHTDTIPALVPKVTQTHSSESKPQS